MLRITLSVILFVGAVVGLAACTGDPTPSATPKEQASESPAVVASGDGVLRIGTLFPMSGDAAASGAAQVAGTELAAREIAELVGSGLPIELVHRDSAGDVTVALADFLARGVDVVLWDAGSVPPTDVAASVASTPAVLLSLADLANGGTPVAPGEAFGARLLTADPGLADTAGGAEGYDGVVVTALAARAAGDDGGASVAAGWKAVTTGTSPCSSWGECLAALDGGRNISYAGASGTLAAFFA
ncbi:ABC transporter substrate-binding protein [Glaciibacter sp. 2TAF33]|uniref:ABC transporter substrate-binding protein n=1 Tax=Glaciibacter sp. 2TAF33 TaxID=3233015 RepID=UPI003F936675